jgi:hypothetical protein
MQHELSAEAVVQVQESLYLETCQAFLHLHRRYDAIRAVGNNPMPNCHTPSNQTSKRAKDAREGQKKRRVLLIKAALKIRHCLALYPRLVLESRKTVMFGSTIVASEK